MEEPFIVPLIGGDRTRPTHDTTWVLVSVDLSDTVSSEALDHTSQGPGTSSSHPHPPSFHRDNLQRGRGRRRTSDEADMALRSRPELRISLNRLLC